jgi:hypothetical protein
LKDSWSEAPKDWLKREQFPDAAIDVRTSDNGAFETYRLSEILSLYAEHSTHVWGEERKRLEAEIAVLRQTESHKLFKAESQLSAALQRNERYKSVLKKFMFAFKIAKAVGGEKFNYEQGSILAEAAALLTEAPQQGG